MNDDPYQTPFSNTHRATDLPLASLSSRFIGALLDGLLSFLAMMPAMLVMFAGSFALTGSFDPDAVDSEPVLQIVVGLLFLFCLILMSGVQWYLISTRGQSIGKIAMRTRIVRLDGSPVDFVTGVILRNWVMGMVQGCMGMFCLGWLVPLGDGMAIFFGHERRCGHDHIAGTVVIDASFDPAGVF